MSDCLFCDVVRGAVPSTPLHSGERTYAFADIDPQAPTHALIVTRDHYPNAAALASTAPELVAELVSVAAGLAVKSGLEPGGYRLVFNTGPDGGQSVDHVHLHLLGGRQLAWPPG